MEQTLVCPECGSENLSWQSLKSIFQQYFIYLIKVYCKLLFDGGGRKKYSKRLMSSVSGLARKQGLDGKMRLCF